jgi:hypothetical protein
LNGRAALPLTHAGCAEPRCALSRFPRIPNSKDTPMVIGVAHLQPIVALIAGILILIVPRLLSFIVAIYLIFIGVMGLGLIR